MSEIEVKILNIDPDQIRDRLQKLGAKLVKKENQINHIYDYPNNRLHNEFKGFCRIREVTSLLDGSKKYILGIKKMISQIDVKEMQEHETEVLSLDQTKRFLTALGLVNTFTNNKHRESYQLDNVLYEIDQWDKKIYPKPYLEVEAKDKSALIKGIELIGYTIEDTTSKSFGQLIRELDMKD